jgi:archaemetzincin
MKTLEVLTVEFDEDPILPSVLAKISQQNNFQVSAHKLNFNIVKFFNVERTQYDAGKILQAHESRGSADKLMLFTSVDLYLPIFTFVFGLAKLGGRAGIVSSHRLNPLFYGLGKNPQLLQERLIKETVHELGHLLNLRHCNDYQCVMASSNTADDIDVKGAEYCAVCRNVLSLETGY